MKFYRQSRFFRVEYPTRQIKMTVPQLQNYIANEVLRSGRNIRKEDVIERLLWMPKSRLLSVFYQINRKQAKRI